MNPGESFDWNCLSSMPICQLDLSPLIRSIGFYHKGCLLTRKSTNSKYPYFLCNTCRLFKGSFVSSDYSSEHASNQFYFDVAQSTTDHGPDCLGATVVIPTTYAEISAFKGPCISSECFLLPFRQVGIDLSPEYKATLVAAIQYFSNFSISLLPDSNPNEINLSQTECQRLLSLTVLSLAVSFSQPAGNRCTTGGQP